MDTVKVQGNSWEDKLRYILLQAYSFPILVGLACAAIFAGTHMYVTHNVGAFNEIFVVRMLDEGLSGGDYAAAAGFAAGFLIARVLEGPLVGVLDIGGALMTGVGIGIPAMMLASGITLPIDNFIVSLITGAGIGLIIGAVIIIIRKFMPQGMSSAGTNIMMGAGNATGQYLGPLIIISAISFSIPAGVGAFVGAAIFYKFDKPVAGGAILGAMVLASFFAV
ncbi:DUF4310 family protein [Alkaliphilus peptidifermentans]|uniref:DUF4310 family protein n=1 Tax=Alkaliphilus peptidifermentans DSM 18978 TaxID=1120976 RepID=A0A1G5ISA7_9FIRM|nr:DUF4310 family protein [Alkaliphilus peptidifermentans]SCY78972.1 conserved hypothetical protein EF_0833/AHA_3914 [Alkaliphilus peptidifermentans DSM 18978]